MMLCWCSTRRPTDTEVRATAPQLGIGGGFEIRWNLARACPMTGAEHVWGWRRRWKGARRIGIPLPGAGQAGHSCSLSCLPSPHPSASTSSTRVPLSTESFCPVHFLCCKHAELQICERRWLPSLPCYLRGSSHLCVSYLVLSNLSLREADMGGKVTASYSYSSSALMPNCASRSPFLGLWLWSCCADTIKMLWWWAGEVHGRKLFLQYHPEKT